MKNTWIALLTGLVLGLPGLASAQTRAPEVDSLALARQYTRWLYAGEADSLVAHSSESARESFATVEQYSRYTDLIGRRAGFETDEVEEVWKLRNGECQYWRIARFTDLPELFLLRWVLDDEGRISGIGAGPLSQAPPVEAETCRPAE